MLMLEKPKVYIVEDSLFTLDSWIEMLEGECRVYGFVNPDIFLKSLENSADFLSGVDLVITDFYFDALELTGAAIAEQVKLKNPKTLVFLSSNGFRPGEARPDHIDLIIPKFPTTYALLMSGFAERNV